MSSDSGGVDWYGGTRLDDSIVNFSQWFFLSEKSSVGDRLRKKVRSTKAMRQRGLCGYAVMQSESCYPASSFQGTALLARRL